MARRTSPLPHTSTPPMGAKSSPITNSVMIVVVGERMSSLDFKRCCLRFAKSF